ncbi:MAG: CPBP family intramembrane metalloprotease [Leptolyngbya sp. SIO1E4]|nr:CPBP family intramembrane metalloprotease [Leptolyngbya sp. SIO1E4]
MVTSPPKPLLKQLWEFIRRPTFPALSVQPLRQTCSELNQLFWLSLAVRFLLSIPLIWATTQAGLDNQLPTLFEGVSVLWVLTLGAVLIPFFEEVLFRLFLRPSPLNLVGTLLPVLYLLGIPLVTVMPGSILARAWLLLTLIVGAVLYLIVKKYYSVWRVEQFYSRRMAPLYYGSSILFGFVHVFNFAGIERYFYLSPLIMLPYAIFGLLLGYVRIKHGFQWAVVLHAVNNAYAFLPLVMMYGLTGTVEAETLTRQDPQPAAVVAGLMIVVWAIGSLWMMFSTCRHLFREVRRYRPDV